MDIQDGVVVIISKAEVSDTNIMNGMVLTHGKIVVCSD